MMGAWLDIRGGLQHLRGRKFVTALAVLSLALAIAGNTAIFSVTSALLLRPLPFDEPDRLVFLSDRDPNNALGVYVESPANFLDLRQRARSFEELTAFRGASLGLEREDQPTPVDVLFVGAGFFQALRWQPALGRVPLAEEDEPGAAPVAVISHAFWTAQFGAAADIVGRNIDLSGERYRVIGVLPEGVEFLAPTLQIFSPLRLDPIDPGRRDRRGLSVFGRLAADVSLEGADREVAAIAEDLAQEHPQANQGRGWSVISMRDRLISPPNRQLMAVLQAGLLFVLLIACANVANLLLAQGQERSRELAVRAALGAGRSRLLTQLLVESLLLAGMAFFLGLALAAGAIRALQVSLSENLTPSFAPRLEPGVLLFTAVVALGAGLVFGLLPAVRASRPELTSVLREGGRGEAGGRRWLAKGLVVAQLVLALALLAGSAIMIESFRWLQYSSPGFEDEGLYTVTLQLPPSRHADGEEVWRFYSQARDRIAALPQIEDAAFVSLLPRSPFNPKERYRLEGAVSDPDRLDPESIVITTTPGYFETLGIPILRGRDFGPEDRRESPRVAVVNEAFARRHWPQGDPVEDRLVIDDEVVTIVGVVGDVWQELLAGEGGTRSPAIYLPHAQEPQRAMSLVARARGDGAGIPGTVRAAVWEVDPRLSVGAVVSFQEYVGQFFGTDGLDVMLQIFGGLALLLAAVGIYGVIAFSVERRTREIGLRIALGASRARILRLVGMEGIKLLLVGLALGVPAVLLVMRIVRAALSGLVPIQIGAVLPALALLVVVALAASYLPARRASSLEPTNALRTD